MLDPEIPKQYVRRSVLGVVVRIAAQELPTYAPLCAYAVAAGLLAEPLDISDPIALYPEDIKRANRDVEELIHRHPLF